MERDAPTEERRRVEVGRAIVREVALRLARQLGGTVPRSDLESIGDEALVTLLRAHDPTASPLEAYLRRFVRWAMLDALRSRRREAPLGSRVRGLAACQWLSAASEDPEHEAALGRDALAAFREALSMRATVLVLSELGGRGVVELPADSTHFPERIAIRMREREVVRAAIAAIAEPLRDLLVRHYFGDEPFDRIALELGLSTSQVCRLHRRALSALDRALRERGVASLVT
ncbi:MAG: sigma-70 family RNA polymerase sigma factor [Deltaproteobacteria bacterium]|nr:sigma-70 family RNA polymerase sigma factor [Deltaproteobacteria bacterium]